MDDQIAGAATPRPTWRLVMDVVQAQLGWVLAAVGGVLLLVCYWFVSGEGEAAKQLPYIVSAGFVGLALVCLGSALLAADRISAARIDQSRLAAQVEDLHTLIVGSVPGPADPLAAAPPGPAPAEPVDSPAVAPSALSDGMFYAVPTGRTFHRASCELLTGKPAQPVGAMAVATRSLSPCSVCAPNPPA